MTTSAQTTNTLHPCYWLAALTCLGLGHAQSGRVNLPISAHHSDSSGGLNMHMLNRNTIYPRDHRTRCLRSRTHGDRERHTSAVR
jgi:hypothetical protein